MDKLATYSQMIDEFAWYGNGDIFEIAKAARKLGRNYMDDIANRKLQAIEANERRNDDAKASH